jgi:sigma-B regulation protein RsbU (phosphoserine phosphatase)
MLKKISIKQKILFLVFIIITLSVAGYTKLSIEYTERAETEKIDKLLQAIAYGTQYIVGDAYHDAIEDSTSITKEDYAKLVKTLNEFARNVDVKEVYSYINHNGELRFTSGGLNYKYAPADQVDSFFEKYEGDAKIADSIYFKPLRDNQPLFYSYKDVYGAVRSAFFPFKTSNGKSYVVAVDYSAQYIDQLTGNIIKTFLLVGFCILIIALILAYIFINQISKPLKNLVFFTNELVTNDFQLTENSQYKLNIFSSNYKDEVGKLSGAFLSMQISLKKYIVDLRKTTVAKESMEGQLKIASAIQLGMIPKEYPAFPKQNEFNIYGIMHPAKEVGGDLYNYFMIDEDHLGFTIGDVSGKGIPAALFMAMTNTLIKAIALSGLSPAEVLFKANNELCKDNDQSMFVTLLFAILNIKTGEVEFANAGHNPFIWMQNGQGVDYRKLSSGMVLAAFENFEFVNERLTLKKNDTLFMYTDGVTEAMNNHQQLFGEKRLLELIQSSKSMAIPELVDQTLNGLSGFVNGYEQSDDITILTLRFLSEKKEK